MAKAPEKNPIEQLWEMFARETIPEGAPAAQQRAMYLSFLAGADTVLLTAAVLLSVAMAVAWSVARHPGKSGWTEVFWTFAIGAAGVLTALGQSIVSGPYSAGQVLNLDGVSATYGVSRSVAREAIRVLESMGMVASRRRVGITIQPSTNWNVFDPRVIRWRLDSGDLPLRRICRHRHLLCHHHLPRHRVGDRIAGRLVE